MSNINLDGGERSIIRSLGFGGSALTGAELRSRVGNLDDNTLFSTLRTMILLGYVSAQPDLKDLSALDTTAFFVNPGYARDLKEALEPQAPPKRRVRRQ